MEQTGDTTLASPPQRTVIFYEPSGLLIQGVAVTAGLLCIFPTLMVSAIGWLSLLCLTQAQGQSKLYSSLLCLSLEPVPWF